MPKKEEIQIIIDNDGNPTLTVTGVAGRSCLDVTKDIERALGSTVKDTPTPELYARPESNQHLNKR